MFTEAEFADLVRDAESTMVDTFQAFSVTRQKVAGIDKTIETPEYETLGEVSGRGSGPGAGQTDGRTVNLGGKEVPVIAGGLKIPISKPPPVSGWIYECTAVAPTSDPALVGRRWRVVDVRSRSWATKRRLDVVEV